MFSSASNLIIRTLQRAYVMLLYSLSTPERHASDFYLKRGSKWDPSLGLIAGEEHGNIGA